jgi:hypothetical protein
MPEEKQSRGERDQEQISHLRGQAGGVVDRRLPNKTPENSPDKVQRFHAGRVYFARLKYPLNLRPFRTAAPSREPSP